MRSLVLFLRTLLRVKTPSRLKVGNREFKIRVGKWPARSHFLATNPKAYSYRLTATTVIGGASHRICFTSKTIKRPSRLVDRMVRLGLWDKAKESLSRSCHTN